MLLLKNLMTIADRAFVLVRPLARKFAQIYYRAVREYGETAYNECERERMS
jgi:hypothetical protein